MSFGRTLAYTILITLAIVAIQGYGIEGQWRLTHLHGSSLPVPHNVTVSIEDFIFRNTSIKTLISFNGCQNFKFIMEREQNNLYIDYDTYNLESEIDGRCLYEDLLRQKKIANQMKKVFTFQIITNFMVFSDAEGTVIFKFERVVKQKQNSITGNWVIRSFRGTQVSELVEISQDTLSFCKRKVEIGYETEGNKIQWTGEVKDEGCEQKQLVSAFQKAKFFVRRGKTTQMFDEKDNFIFSMNFVLDLKTAQAQKQAQRKESAEQQIKAQQQLKNKLEGDIADTEKLIEEKEKAIEAAKDKQQLLEKLQAERDEALQRVNQKREEQIEAAKKEEELRKIEEEKLRLQILQQKREEERIRLQEERQVAIEKAQKQEEERLAAIEKARLDLLAKQREEERQRLVEQRNAAIEAAKAQGPSPTLSQQEFSVVGKWKITKISTHSVSEAIEIDESSIKFCEGKAKLPLKIDKLLSNGRGYNAIIGKVSNMGCPFVAASTQDLESIAYISRRGESLAIFNDEDEIIMQGSLILDPEVEQQNRKFREDEKKRQEEIERLREEERLRILAERAEANRQAAIQQAKIKAGVAPAQPIPSPQPPKTTIVTPPLHNNRKDLVGKWKIISIFKVPNFFDNFELIFTEDTALLAGGCNSHILPYTTLPSAPQQMLLGKMRSTKIACPADDDGFFLTGLNKMKKFSVRVVGQEMQAVIDDENGKRVFELTRSFAGGNIVQAAPSAPVTRVTTTPTAIVPPRVPTEPVAASKNEIEAGKFKILLINRRDLSLKIATYADFILSFSVCNQLKFQFKQTDKNQPKISISLLDTIAKPNTTSCNIQNEKVYIETFKKVTEFKKQGFDTFLLDQEGNEIANLGSI